MAGFLKIIGIIVFVLAGAAGALTVTTGGVLTFFAMLPALIGGAATYGLGEIMENVKEIRDNSKRTADALDRMTAPRPNGESQASSFYYRDPNPRSR